MHYLYCYFHVYTGIKVEPTCTLFERIFNIYLLLQIHNNLFLVYNGYEYGELQTSDNSNMVYKKQDIGRTTINFTGGVNHFIPYLAMRHRMVTKVNKLLWLTVHSIIMGGGAPSSNKPSSVSLLLFD